MSGPYYGEMPPTPPGINQFRPSYPPMEVPLRPILRQARVVQDEVEFNEVVKEKKPKDKIKSEFRGFNIQKINGKFDVADRTESVFSQADLAKEALKSYDKHGRSTALKKYWELSDNKRSQVDALLQRTRDEEKKADAEWSLAHLQTFNDKTKSGRDAKISRIFVILRRHGKDEEQKGSASKDGDKKASKEQKSEKESRSCKDKPQYPSVRGEVVDINKPQSKPSDKKDKKDKGEGKTKPKDDPPSEEEDYDLDPPIIQVFPDQRSPPPPPMPREPRIINPDIYEPTYPGPFFGEVPQTPAPKPNPIHHPYVPHVPQTYPRPQPPPHLHDPFPPRRPPTPPIARYPLPTPRHSNPSVVSSSSCSSDPLFSDLGSEYTDFSGPSGWGRGGRYRREQRGVREEDFVRYTPRRGGERGRDDRRDDDRRRYGEGRRDASRHRDEGGERDRDAPRRRSGERGYDRDRDRDYSPDRRDRRPSPDRRDDRRRISPGRYDRDRDYRYDGRRASPGRVEDRRREEPRRFIEEGRRSGPSSALGSRGGDDGASRYGRGGREQIDDLVRRVYEDEREEEILARVEEGVRAGIRAERSRR
ncbi:Dynactin, isoform [Elsinoe australis]|uniref:Dynactin, isoform n=1 Tax=Elsinoe australis TaxID=40998 RepID=A0A2P7Z4L2_9PEZI|nr:Dynactin, isoform [Elsinoe australis]